MKTAQLGDIFEYQGVLVEVKWINQGYKAIGFVPVNAKPCECCGETKHWDVIESSPNFQEYAIPVQTIKESKRSR
jgi:hypothetical protein